MRRELREEVSVQLGQFEGLDPSAASADNVGMGRFVENHSHLVFGRLGDERGDGMGAARGSAPGDGRATTSYHRGCGPPHPI
jgi:hypothetical protein